MSPKCAIPSRILIGLWMLGVTLLLAAASPGGEAPPSVGDAPRPHAKVPDPTETVRPAAPAVIDVGLYAVRMSSIDITNNQYSIDFYVWFRWKDEALKPYETFELVNGKIDSRQLDCVRRLNGQQYACVRVTATVTKAWDVRRFPLGRQTCTLEIEDSDLEADQLRYVADAGPSGVDAGLDVSGWKVDGCVTDVTTHVYATTYGDIRQRPGKTAQFSRFVFTTEMSRKGIFHSLKIFSGLYMAALVAFTAFFVKPDHRLGVNIGAVFAVVASHTVISSYLPEAGVLTLADKLHLVTAAVIVVALFETAYALHLQHRGRPQSVRRFDRITFWITAPAYLAANAFFLVP